MDDKTLEMLDEEIQAGLECMSDIEGVNIQEYGDAVNNVTKLMDRQIEMKKLVIEETKLEHEKEVESKKMKSENIDRWVKNGLGAIGTIGGIVLTVWGTKKTFQFEETGSITSSAGRKFIDRLFKKQ